MTSAAPQQADLRAEKILGLKHKIRLGEPDAPIIFLVHGRAGNFDVMWTFKRAIPDHYTVIAPQAPLEDPIGGFSWWQVGAKGVREEGTAQLAAERLRSFLEKSLTHYSLTPSAILAAGFSQGAALLSVMLQRNDNPFEGVALLAGFVLRDNQAVRGKTSSVLILHGSKDDVVPIEMARLGERHLLELGYAVEFIEDPVGHKIGAGSVRALTRWVGSFAAQE